MLGKKFSYGLFLVFAAVVLVVNSAIASWTIETVDPKQFYPTAIAVDLNNHPHIVYGSNHLYYAYYDGSSWHSETVDSSSSVGYSVSIAVDSSGKAHISYYDGVNEYLKYATNISGTWAITTVDSGGDTGYYNSIAIDSSGKVHISYMYYSGYAYLKYATNASGSWVKSTVGLERKLGSGLYSC